ncbi:NAD(P)H-binding protein [Streptomyces sp. YC504]|uniref:NAD(P)H-binding protein n=1 Tax=Streptomyces mesophilus TaxID=1775132 RepID=A0A6G4XKS6_9ACTN|nr:NAD(P)H-binding protein [Streptomyces mesophilus]NGO77231.1 NAD(P)H-binding protein [Streptomyces mesophilus]
MRNHFRHVEAGQAITLVLGGTGKTGSRVVTRLRELGLPVRVGSRSVDPPFDWADRSTWGPALTDVAAVYVTYYPDLATPGAPEAVGAFADLAVRSGARRLVMLSGRGEPEAEAAEKLLRASGADWTILRAAWFSQNFSENYLLEPVQAGEVVLPAGDVPEPFVDVDDIADVATATLTRDGHSGQIYDLTGPRLLTMADAVAEIGAAAGRTISFVPVPAGDYAAALAAEGVPGEVVELMFYLFTIVLDGRNAHLGDGVQQVLGRPARDFSDYARDTAATGIWTQKGAV